MRKKQKDFQISPYRIYFLKQNLTNIDGKTMDPFKLNESLSIVNLSVEDGILTQGLINEGEALMREVDRF